MCYLDEIEFTETELLSDGFVLDQEYTLTFSEEF